MNEEELLAHITAIGLEQAHALFPGEIRAAAQLAAEERAALGRVDDPAVGPA